MSRSQPPAIPTRLLRRFYAGPSGEAVAGDLIEQYRTGRSRVWYWRQVFGAILTHRPMTLFALAGVCGLVLGFTFHLTDELIVVAVVCGFSALLGGVVVRGRAWIWGLGVGIGIVTSRLLFPERHYVQSARELALYGAPRPLHLPFGLTSNPLAQHAVVELVIVSFVFGAALVGWLLSRAQRT